jgi:fructokinase
MSDEPGQDPSVDVSRQTELIARRIADLPQSDARLLVAIAGPPGAGKSTVAKALTDLLVSRGHAAVLMPMDGFHIDDRLLQPRGLLARKGAPETFDFEGFAAAVGRVRSGSAVLLPVFDRDREIAIAAAQEISPETRIVVVEGNYLCFDEAPWSSLSSLWDFSVYLDVPTESLERRLIDRWLAQGLDQQEACAKAQGNDLANARRVVASLAAVDLVLRPTDS